MVLDVGRRLGPFEILGPLGAGGMGEVYRARDTRLGREVAVKVLPKQLSDDPAALGRFEREARAVAGLSHPNILGLFDFAQQDGVAYAVYECLVGETLRASLRQGPLAVRKTVDYATQIAHGLAAAHEKGVVHRDLKPENLFVTVDGRVKILDFGLALQRNHPAINAETASPTLTRDTDPGAVLGTAGYMSPEQVRGQPADARSDIFSLGIVLHEMATGERPFRRETAAETMAAILRDDPPSFVSSGGAIPPGLERIVRHCLEKAPAQRFQSARDLAFDLAAISDVSESGASRQRAAGLDGARAGRRLAWTGAGATALAIALGLAYGVGHVAGERGGYKSPKFTLLTHRRGVVGGARFSADGHTVYYTAMWGSEPLQIFSTSPGACDSRAFGLQDAGLLALSSSGDMAVLLRPVQAKWAGSGTSEGTLARVSSAGGAPRQLQEDVQHADWFPDGERLVIVRSRNARSRIESPPGAVLYETTGRISELRVSPRGDRIAFIEHPDLYFGDGSVASVDTTGKKTTLTRSYTSLNGLAWGPSGREVWFTASPTGEDLKLRAVTLDGREREVLDVPGSVHLEDIGRDGRVLLASWALRRELHIQVPGEAREHPLPGLDNPLTAALSKDGRTALYLENGDTGTWLLRLDGSSPVRLGRGYPFDLSPDLRWAVVVPSFDEPRVVLLPLGPGEPRRVSTAGILPSQAFSLPDQKSLLLVGAKPGERRRVWMLNVDAGTAQAVTPEGMEAGDYAPVSTDGRHFVARDASGSFFVYPTGAGDPRPLPGVRRPEWSVGWSENGKEVFVMPHELPARIRVFGVDVSTGSRQAVLTLELPDPASVGEIVNLVMTPDGRGYMYDLMRRLSDLYLVEGLR